MIKHYYGYPKSTKQVYLLFDYSFFFTDCHAIHHTLGYLNVFDHINCHLLWRNIISRQSIDRISGNSRVISFCLFSKIFFFGCLVPRILRSLKPGVTKMLKATSFLLVLIPAVLGVIDWQTSDQVAWSFSCDFPQRDLENVKTTGPLCGPRCVNTPRCDHFTWTTFNGGTCWMKTGVQLGSAWPYAVEVKDTGDNSMVCGFLPSKAGQPQITQHQFLINSAIILKCSISRVYVV